MSEFIRQAAADRVETTLAIKGADQFADVIGAIHGGGGRARNTGAAFRELLIERHDRS